MFFGKMAELGASCYFNTKQCVAAWMVMSGIIAGGALYSDALSGVGDNGFGNFVNGGRKKAFISIWYQRCFFIYRLWHHRNHSESHDSGGHVDMGSGLDCVDNFICDSGENGI